MSCFWILLLLLPDNVHGHGSLIEPLSKNEMAYKLRDWGKFPNGMPASFRYEPWTANYGNLLGSIEFSGGASCGAKEEDYAQGLGLWRQWYDSSGTPVPTVTPGADLLVRARMTADHGGQAWFMIACGSGEIDEQLSWTLLERSPSDRGHHFMPSNPGIYAWETGEAAASFGGITTALYAVPAAFSCSGEEAVGRWLWKTGNTCNDVNNLGRNTEPFSLQEFADVVHSYAPGENVQEACTSPPEVFVSCVDFKIAGSGAPSPPASISPTSQAPSPLTPSTTSTSTSPSETSSASLQTVTSPSPGLPLMSTSRSSSANSCTKQEDCSISAWCQDPAYVEWCPTQGRAGWCPTPHCKQGPAEAPSPSPVPVTGSCRDLALEGAWGAGGAYTCATYLAHGGKAYCAHAALAEACCFCKDEVGPAPEPQPQPADSTTGQAPELQPKDSTTLPATMSTSSGQGEEPEPEPISCLTDADCGEEGQCCCADDSVNSDSDSFRAASASPRTCSTPLSLMHGVFAALQYAANLPRHAFAASSVSSGNSSGCICIPIDASCQVYRDSTSTPAIITTSTADTVTTATTTASITSLHPTTTASVDNPTPMPTPTPIPASCVNHSVLMCINEASSFWPKCDPIQIKEVEGPSGYLYGHYCTQEWVDALNEMLSNSAVDKCDDNEAIHKLLAQVAYETAYFSTVYQPRDGGAGLIHMIPGNWVRNAVDMDAIFPGNSYSPLASVMGQQFFQVPEYGWRSVAAWFKKTNEVIPGCGLDLFDQPFEMQTKCILAHIVSRQESYDIVARCMRQTPAVPAPSPSPPSEPAPSPAPLPAPVPSPLPAPAPAPDAVETVMELLEGLNPKNLFLYNTGSGWVESQLYRWSDMISAVRVMATQGIGSQKLWLGHTASDAVYGLVNIAAFLAQAMQETIQYNACDENNWSDPSVVAKAGGSAYSATSACGQLHQSYQDYSCTAGENTLAGGQMACSVDPDMEKRAHTQAGWYGAPPKLFCAPKSKVPKAPRWNYIGPWCAPSGDRFSDDVSLGEYFEYVREGGSCKDYSTIKAGGWVYTGSGCKDGACPGSEAPDFGQPEGRTDVEGCCWWGRGVIQTTGACNYGKLNYYMGKRAADEGRSAMYPSIDFCRDPDTICAPDAPKELKWVAGFFYWLNDVQSYSNGGWNYMNELKAWVDRGRQRGDTSFIFGVSGIVNRGCHDPPNCGTGELHAGAQRAQNFHQVLDAMGL